MVEVLKPERGGLGARGRVARLLADPPALAVLALCAAVLGLRRAEAMSRPQFWAEDVIFYQRALLQGWQAFLGTDAGYFHMVLRAVAAAGASVDPSLAPAVFVGAAALITLYVASRTLSRRCPLPRYAGLCALAIVLVPDTHEVLLNVVNLQWVLGAGLVLLLLSGDPVGPGSWAHDLVAALALGLTGPFSIFLAPAFALRAISRRSRASLVICALICACALVQAYLVYVEPTSPFDTTGAAASAGLFLPAIGRRLGGSPMMGAFLARDTDQVFGTLAGILTLAGIGYLSLGPGSYRVERRLLGLVLAVVLAGALYRTRHSLFLFFVPHTRARYFYLPQLFTLWLLISWAVQKGRAARVCAALALWALAVNLPRLREAPLKDLNWPSYAEKIRVGEDVTVETNPPVWRTHFPRREK